MSKTSYPVIEVPFREYGYFAVKSDPSRPTLEEMELKAKLELAKAEIRNLRAAHKVMAETFEITADLAMELAPGPLFDEGEVERVTEPPKRLL